MQTMLGDDDPIPLVAVRIDGQLGRPLLVIPAAVLDPEAAVEYARAIFSSAAMACRQSRLDVAGRC